MRWDLANNKCETSLSKRDKIMWIKPIKQIKTTFFSFTSICFLYKKLNFRDSSWSGTQVKVTWPSWPSLSSLDGLRLHFFALYNFFLQFNVAFFFVSIALLIFLLFLIFLQASIVATIISKSSIILVLNNR